MEIALIDKNEGFENRFHTHQWFDISFVMKGSLIYEIGQNKYSVSAGEVIIIPPGKLHKETCDLSTDFEVLFVCARLIRKNKQIDVTEYLQIPEVSKIQNQKEIYRIFGRILNEVTYRNQGYLLQVKAEVYHLLVLLFRNEAGAGQKTNDIKKLSNIRKKKIVDDIKDYFYHNYNQKISMGELSKSLYLSTPYISSVFKKQTGYTPVEFLNKVRMDKAKALFAAGETDIGKVAESVGISDIHYFYKVFKMFESMTPVAYIELNL